MSFKIQSGKGEIIIVSFAAPFSTANVAHYFSDKRWQYDVKPHERNAPCCEDASRSRERAGYRGR